MTILNSQIDKDSYLCQHESLETSRSRTTFNQLSTTRANVLKGRKHQASPWHKYSYVRTLPILIESCISLQGNLEFDSHNESDISRVIALEKRAEVSAAKSPVLLHTNGRIVEPLPLAESAALSHRVKIPVQEVWSECSDWLHIDINTIRESVKTSFPVGRERTRIFRITFPLFLSDWLPIIPRLLLLEQNLNSLRYFWLLGLKLTCEMRCLCLFPKVPALLSEVQVLV